MTVAQQSVIARDQIVIIEPQVSLGTMVIPTAGGGVRVRDFQITYEQALIERQDNKQSAGSEADIQGATTVAWTLEEDLRPSGTAGTAPDDQELWESLFGVETIDPGVSVTYSFSTVQAIQLLSFHRAHGYGTACQWLESLVDAAVDKLKISQSGSEPAKLTWSGYARKHVLTVPALIEGEIAGAPAGAVETADTNAVEVDSVVQLGATTGNRITAKSGTSITLASAVTVSDGAQMLPWCPSPTTTGRPVAGIDGSFTLVGPGGSAVVLITAVEMEIAKGVKPYNDECFQKNVTDFGVGMLKVTGSVTFRARRSELQRIAAAKNDGFTARAMTIVMGGEAGRTYTFPIPRAQLSFKGVSFPGNGDEVTVTMPFKALISGPTANDALTAVIT